ncbi:N-acetyltransferase [Devosia pacifica]|uniref:N-acetyltransferase n=1 Tax=Devosia pacifica TaxID=1335967 RepID=A0A918VPB5_9HYPH|nr:GNAT family N-acetyltransferase [Devosia pacifica]GHA12433.1 N-acetyltransferase [Devosia pacifica]
MAVSIAIETPLQDDVRRLVDQLNAHLMPLSPPQFQFKMTVEEMAGPETTVFVARDGAGEAVGIGALRLHEGGVAEVKRMYTAPSVRGQRVGREILQAIVDEAANRSVTHLVLETGTGEGFAGAHRLYSRYGFSARGPVLDYPENPWSAFYEMHLAPGPVGLGDNADTQEKRA